MEILGTPISLFKSAQSVEPVTVTLHQFLSSRRHIDTITLLRAEPDTDVRNALKKTLPAATISGTFSRRAANAITHYNGLVCLDFDAKDNPDLTPDQMKAILADINEVAYAARSVGGAGVFAIVPTNNTDPTLHPRLVEILEGLFRKMGLVIDRACKDVSRLRFVSWDEKAWTNPDPAVFDAARWLSVAAQNDERESRRPRPVFIREPRRDGDTVRRRVEEYIAAIEGSARDVTENYDDWIRLGFALANAFGADGEDYFQRISQFNPKYDHAETARKFQNCLTNGRSTRIGTFFKILNDQGIRL